MDVSIIVAHSLNRVIGNEGKLIWNIKSDLKRYTQLTKGKRLIMGRKTYESLPSIWKDTSYFVLSEDDNAESGFPNVTFYSKAGQVTEHFKYSLDNTDVFIIGGESVFKKFMHVCNKMYITEVQANFIGDTYFPEFNEEEWRAVYKEVKQDCGFITEFKEYVRVK